VSLAKPSQPRRFKKPWKSIPIRLRAGMLGFRIAPRALSLWRSGISVAACAKAYAARVRRRSSPMASYEPGLYVITARAVTAAQRGTFTWSPENDQLRGDEDGMEERFFWLAWRDFRGSHRSAQALDVSKVPPGDWIDIFNGKDMDGWVPKSQEPRPAGSFQHLVCQGWASYGWTIRITPVNSNNRFGHMAYQKRKFSYYLSIRNLIPGATRLPEARIGATRTMGSCSTPVHGIDGPQPRDGRPALSASFWGALEPHQ